MDLDLRTLGDFATALSIGALIGIEREKRAVTEQDRGIGGVRTFILIAGLGALAGWLAREHQAPWLVGVALVVVGMVIVAGYVLAARKNPESLGLTTEVAALVVCLLAAAVLLGERELGVALGVVTAAVLAYKDPLHGIVARLGWDDVFAGVRLLLATFVILPLLPDRPVDPWGALNPRSLWILVLLISSLSLVGYVATRSLGAHRGTMATGLAGGMVSSTAVTLAFARQSREKGAVGTALAAGILLAWSVMFVRVLIEVLVVNAALARPLAPALAGLALASGLCAWVLFRRGARAAAPSGEGVAVRNPFSLTQAAKFAALFAVVMLVVEAVKRYSPGEGFYVVAAIAGLTDVDAITLSMAEYAKSGAERIAVDSIVIAALSNTLVKTGMVVAVGGRDLRRALVACAAGLVVLGILMIVVL
jgi:uncharacterized membrane protein (DUF4010 family)